MLKTFSELGQAGVGKSRLVTSTFGDCKSRNVEVGVVLSSGIACIVYGRGIASTEHSFCGLGTVDMLANEPSSNQFGMGLSCRISPTKTICFLANGFMLFASTARL